MNSPGPAEPDVLARAVPDQHGAPDHAARPSRLGDEPVQSLVWDTVAGQATLHGTRGRHDGHASVGPRDERDVFDGLADDAFDALRDRARAAARSGSELSTALRVRHDGRSRSLWLHGERLDAADPASALQCVVVDVSGLAASLVDNGDSGAVAAAEPSRPGRFSWDDATRVVQLSAEAAALLDLGGPGAYPVDAVEARFDAAGYRRLLQRVVEVEAGDIVDVVAHLRGGDRSVHVRAMRSSSGVSGFTLTGTVQDVRDEQVLGGAVGNLARALNTLSHATRVLHTSPTRQRLLDDVCRSVVRDGGYVFCWYGVAEHGPDKRVRPVAWAGVEDGYLTENEFHWDPDVPTGRGPAGSAIQAGEVRLSHLLAADATVGPWRDSALARGYVATVALPVRVDGAVDVALGRSGRAARPRRTRRVPRRRRGGQVRRRGLPPAPAARGRGRGRHVRLGLRRGSGHGHGDRGRRDGRGGGHAGRLRLGARPGLALGEGRAARVRAPHPVGAATGDQP